MIIFKEYEDNWNEVQFGTCELCMSTGFANEYVFVFEDTETGKEIRIDNFEWDWGDFWENRFPIKNLVNFGYFIKGKNIQDEESFNFVELYEEYKRVNEPEVKE